MIHPTTLKDKERLLYRRTLELVSRAEACSSPEFSYFLNPREQNIAKAATTGDMAVFFGGFRGAQRQMLGVFPTNVIEDNFCFPIKAVEIITASDDRLNHRWVLGTLTGMGIAREAIGDIITDFGSSIVVVTETVQPVILAELKKVGSVGVSVRKSSLENITQVDSFETITGTVSSLRLDNIVALLTRQSRAKSLELFKAGKVIHNYQTCDKPITIAETEDIITVTGYGKYIFDSVGATTKKGRLPIECRKFV